MQRINVKKNIFKDNQSMKSVYSTIKAIPNGNNAEEIPQKLMNFTKRSNKFLPIQERQKIIREINKSQNKFNLFKPSPPKEGNTKINTNNQNILYVKKRKSLIARSNEKTSFEERKMKLVNGINNVKLKGNKILVNKTINNKEKYEKNKTKVDKMINIKNRKNIDNKKSINYELFKDNDKIKRNNLYKKNSINKENNKIAYKDEIYKKPINGKTNNKISVNLNKAYKKKNNRQKNLNSNIVVDIMNSVKKEKMNCTKMMNTNGSKKTIFNMINNYNTQTVKNNGIINYSYYQNGIKPNNKNLYLQRNNSISVIPSEINNKYLKNNLKPIINSPKYLYQNIITNQNYKSKIYSKNRSVSTNKNIKEKKPLYLNEKFTNYNYNIIQPKNESYIINNVFSNILTEIDKNKSINIELKNSRQNLNNSQSFPKKPLLDTNLISNDLLNELVEKDLISFTYNIDKFNNENLYKPFENKIKVNDNEKLINNKNYNSPRINISRIRTDRSRNKKCGLYLSLTSSSKKFKKYKTFSLRSNKDEEEEENDNNLKYAKSRNKYELKNIRNNSYKDLGNSLISKEIIFPIKLGRSNSLYNSDDDIMNSNSKIEIDNKRSSSSLENNNLKNIRDKTKNISNLYYNSKDLNNNENVRTRSQSKDYFFNYLSKKINSNILNEDKINKLGKDLYNINFFKNSKYCESCRSNYTQCSCKSTKNENQKFKYINKKIVVNPTIEDRSFQMDNKNNNEFYKENYCEENNEDNNSKNNLITKKPDLKLDISNGMHNSQNNNNQSSNINSVDNGYFNSNKFEMINTYDEQETKPNLNKKGKRELEETNQIIFQKNKNIKIDKSEQLKILPENKFDKKRSKEEGNIIIFELNEINKANNKIMEEKYNKNEIRNSKNENIRKNNKINYKKKENKEYANINQIKSIQLEEKPIKYNYINEKNQKISPILSDILENVNIITPKNYFLVKNQILKLIKNNDNNIPMEFVNMLYPIAIKQIIYQPIYSKLFKDIDKFYQKKDKNKSIIRTQLMKLCKSNFKKIKTRLENIKNISSDINFIGELINSQMVSKKVGLQCLTHLFNKFQKYNDDKEYINRKEEKYLYLDNIINLLNKFATCIYCYQKEKIRDNELYYFEEEIDKDIELLKEIINDEKNNDMPSKTKINLLNLIKKSENDWNLSFFEQHKNNLLKSIYENINNDDFNNIKNKSDNNNPFFIK